MDDNVNAESKRFLTFKLNREEYAVNILHVREIRNYELATKLPMTEEYIQGVINMRGAIIPLVDLRIRFGLKPVERTKNTAIIILQIQREKTTVAGIVVDEVSDIYSINDSDIDPSPEINSNYSDEENCITGVSNVAGKMLIILNQNNLIEN